MITILHDWGRALCFLTAFHLILNLPLRTAHGQSAPEQPIPAPSHNLLVQALSEGTAYLNGRYRYEYVDDEAVPEDANASTLRTRLGMKTSERFALQGKIEFEDIRPVGNDLYNSTVNGRDDRAVVADPDITEVNEALLTYSGVEATSGTFGRYTLNLDNQRFIGDVDWRQNSQTFDGALVTNESVESLKLLYAYIYNVNRVFGDDSPVGDFHGRIHLFNASYSGLPGGTATLYSYLLDLDEANELSSASFGGRVYGAVGETDRSQLLYDCEYAFQTDYADNETDYSAGYYRLESGISRAGFKFLGGFESLGSGNSVGFSTPLATLHRWNGWADKFLNTPPTGLNDGYASIAYAVPEDAAFLFKQLAATVTYHYFSAETDNQKYGEEWDAQLLKPITDRYVVGLKYAAYSADSFAEDTEKLMGWISYKFSHSAAQ